MSVEASKWARMADVQKSSSKLVLLNLAQLVRYDAEQWTVFASIDYLAKVTHLNRKTVIEALGRLRELGAIQDTGRRAGDNRSSIIYRLCRNAVPLIDLAAAGSVAGGEAQAAQHHLALEGRGDDAAAAAPAGGTPPAVDQRQRGDQDRSPLDAMSESSPTADDAIEAGRCSPTDGSRNSAPATHVPTGKAAKGSRKKGRRRQPEARAAGAGPTRLPATWTLPELWRSWAQKQRPLWTHEKIDAMAATFSAYMRSRPGELGTSPDWFESWRLWVFRERESGEAARTAWQNSWTGIVATGKKLGLEQALNEPPPHFKARVFQAAGHVPTH